MTKTPFAQPRIEPTPQRPTGITVVSVLCIIGGIFSIMSALMQAFGQLISAQFSGAFAGDQQQAEWWGEFEALNAKYVLPNLGFAIVVAGLGICLLVGGIALLKPQAWSRRWLRRTLLAAIVVEILHQMLYAVMQIDMYPVMQKQFETMAPAGGGNQQPPPEMLQTFHTVAIVIGFVFAALWFLTKLTLFIWGRVYLNRDTAKAYCATKSDYSSNLPKPV